DPVPYGPAGDGRGVARLAQYVSRRWLGGRDRLVDSAPTHDAAERWRLMPLSDAGTAMLVALEGERAVPYRDQAGFLTLGVGHRLTVSELASWLIHLGSV